ncbi:DMT family transporter [Brucella pseudogrignonensis]|jgi:drug/metabolite transporter (DMT)-like permease|uniref:DMT family transporter n=1 Tax=Brucella/Ochrobactrum group TaxID=2826938 RepID=UPI000CFCC496|nr:DMT family transporter [Brucella pseudogrignonensis]MBO1023935.1 DMT family transporter [Ochrobactrum sp. SD129]MQP38609.1 EamA family transporter [Ochrobactrum sp. MYb237]QWK78775.1 DMT family transporter [Ochrobactrum sp. BTU1]PQZ43229.1 EamA family transporter [Brucella pseudogrignonensis]PRA42976.1 EamA family transporter [Brucella pseudogrignonensis]
MLLAMGTFTIGDTMTKYLLTQMNSGQYMFIRGIFATIAIGLLAWRNGALRNLSLDLMTVLRVLGEVLATVTYIFSLGHLSQAFCSAVFQATPLVVTLGAVLFLNEKVGWRRWMCISFGLVGVIIIIRPGTDSSASLAAVGILLSSVCFAAMRDIATRRVPAHVPTLYLSTLTAGAIALTGGGLIHPMGGWQPVGIGPVLIMALAAGLLLVGYHFIIMAMREGEISFVSPFRYSSLLWAILLSTVVFNEAPDSYTIAGSILVVGSGIYMVYRENIRKRREQNKSTLATTPTGVDPS